MHGLPAPAIAIKKMLNYKTYAEFATESLGGQVMFYSDRKRPKPHYYAEVICVFDIESTSFEVDGKKIAWMYEWSFSINGYVIYGRTWEQFLYLLELLKKGLGLNLYRRLAIYIHNEAFEFQFFRKLFKWEDIFATKAHTPIRAVTVDGIEFRCSYVLSGQALAGLTVRDRHALTSVPNLPAKYVMHKTHDLEYGLVRHYATPLTDEELRYCALDVIVVAHWIYDKMEANDDHIATIPMTRTGYVRRDVRRNTLNGPNAQSYQDTIRAMTLTVDDYNAIRSAFMGGFTHANAMYVGVTLYDVTSMDLTSSYPTVMIAYKFPCSSFVRIDVKSEQQFNQLLQDKACIFDLHMKDVTPRIDQDSPIPASKCHNQQHIREGIKDGSVVVNNGRVYSADELIITVSEVDFQIYKKFYDFDFTIANMHVANKDYLPREYMLTVLKYYELKTTLKSVPGEEVQYALYKEFVNGLYGMTATNIVKEINRYVGDGEHEWVLETPDMESAIKKENRSRNRFLFFGWSYMVTAYARLRLFEAIEYLGMDYIYSDTDSVKFFNYSKHKKWFEQKNMEIMERLQQACKARNIDPDKLAPKNKKGKPCPLGIWDYDGFYYRFKTLGAKRYIYESMDPIEIDEYDDDGPTGNTIIGAYEKRIHTTVAGVSKKSLPKYLATLNGDPFDNFKIGLAVPAEYTGKLEHTYCSEELELTVTDYKGITATFKTYGGVHLAPAEFTMSIANEYEEFLDSFSFVDMTNIKC